MLTLFGRELLTSSGVMPPSPRPGTLTPPSGAAPEVSVHQRGPGVGVAISITLHLFAAAGVLYLQQVQPPRTSRPFTRTPPRLVSLVYMPEIPLDLPTLPAPEPLPPAKVEVRTAEPLRELPKPLPTRSFENRRADVAPAPEALPVEAPPKPVPPKPAPPAVTVGAFANNAVVRTPETNREVEKVAFDNPTVKGTQPKHAETAVGGFDRPVERDARSDNPRPVERVVAETAFGRAVAAGTPAPAGQVVRETGFGIANSRERPRPAESQTAVVTPSGFAAVREAPTVSKPTSPPPPRIVPVEVLSKPTPVYTDEARKLKIEGEVILEVDFVSTGSVRVLRIVRGLGHGLDEAASRAAEQIRFKPAQGAAGPVDFRTTVHIVFRLA